MKKTILKRVAFMLVLAVFVASCDKKPKQLNYIPKDVSGVLTIDTKNLALKSLELKDLLNIDIFKKNIPTSNDSILDKMKNSGIDLISTTYIFGDVAKGDQKNYVAIAFALDDDAKFEKMLKEAGKVSEVKTENDIKYTYIKDAIIGWKDKVALAVFIDGESDKEKVKAKLTNLFAQPVENSLAASNDKFQALLKESADLSVFINYEKFNDLIKQAAQAPMVSDATFKDTYLAATINFEKGKIVSDIKVYNNEANTKKAKELYKASVSKDLISGQPGGDVVAFLSFGINMETLFKHLQEAQLLDGLNQNLKVLGSEFDSNYLAAALSGDFIATLNAINVKEVSKMDYMTGEMKPGKDMAFEYAVSIGLKDPAKLQKLLDSVAAKGIISKTGAFYSASTMAFLVPKTNSLVVVSSEASAKDLADNKITPLSAANIDLMSANTMAMGFDISKVNADVLDLLGEDAKKGVAALPFESIILSAEEVKSEVVTAKTIITFKNKEQNSLISLQQSLKDADLFMPAPPVDSMVMMPSDTVAIVEEIEIDKVR
ncbi:MAG TPA: DUF4836 family protein [Cytophagaceae bacterium]|nr:DUF4836 family protein [Cytophagaceae bacterium]